MVRCVCSKERLNAGEEVVGESDFLEQSDSKNKLLYKL